MKAHGNSNINVRDKWRNMQRRIFRAMIPLRTSEGDAVYLSHDGTARSIELSSVGYSHTSSLAGLACESEIRTPFKPLC